MSDTPQDSVKSAEKEKPYDEELVALIREKGTEGLIEWREKNPDAKINLRKAPLIKVNLGPTEDGEVADLTDAHLEGAKLLGAYLEGAYLSGAHLEGADMSDARLEGAKLWKADLEGAILVAARLEGASLLGAHLEGANMSEADLEGANLTLAHLEEASLREAHLEGAKLVGAHLEGANLLDAHLEKTMAAFAIVDGQTLIANCTYDNNTNFTGVGLAICRNEPAIRADLEYNIRRKHWEEWYKKNKWTWWLSRPAWCFWMLSDYGRSTARLIVSFFSFAILFAVIYLLPTPTWFPAWCPTLDAEPFVTNLEMAPNADGVRVPVDGFQRVNRACYFSIVTMTTLGFGDMHANPESWFGHWLLIAQVLLGYVMLGALITRLAILFQSVK